jgi:Protein of unknown function (DUF2490)
MSRRMPPSKLDLPTVRRPIPYQSPTVNRGAKPSPLSQTGVQRIELADACGGHPVQGFSALHSFRQPSLRLLTIYHCALADLPITPMSKSRDTPCYHQFARLGLDFDSPSARGSSTNLTDRGRTVATALTIMSFTEEIESLVAHRACWLALVLLMLLCRAGRAQSAQEIQFLPEIDAFLKLNPDIRVSVQAKDTRDGGQPTQAQIGPSMEFYVKPLIRLREITIFDLDDAKARPLVLAAGYRYLSSPTSPSTNRLPLSATSHLPIKAQLLLTDRNRADLDWSSGNFTWRYRNMLSLERTLAIRSYHPIPYVSAELYYESQYRKWSTTELYAGSLFPMGKHFQLKVYYEHQNNTGKHPNEQVHGIGATLNLYLSKKVQ